MTRGCAFNQNNQEKLYRSVHKALQDRKLNVLIDGPENASVKLTHTNVSRYLSDDMQILHGVHTHTYWGSRDEKVALRDLCKQHGKKLHVSEYGFALDPNEKTGVNKELKGGIGLAKHICSDINLLRPASWTIWQMDWGLISVQPDYETCFRLHLLPSYFVYKHFTRYIGPGSTFVSVPLPENMVAAKSQTRKTLTIVMVNDKYSEQTYSFKFSNMIPLKHATITQLVTADDLKLAEKRDHQVKGETIEIKLPRISVCTLIIDYSGFLSGKENYFECVKQGSPVGLTELWWDYTATAAKWSCN
ncbi:hypothetical protein HK102_003349 [Quaeritorhiza haematococci]|nr:hypothetical protein HK102_003349 [Quaeritorhiza haematococci]